MSVPTSSAGRLQFSLLKANRVRKPSLRRPHSSTMRRTTLTLARCPATRGMPRERAQRPLPSMMIATCCGESTIYVALAGPATSDLQQLLLLVRHRMIDVGDMLVGELLDFLLRAPVIILRDELFLEHVLEFAHDLAA